MSECNPDFQPYTHEIYRTWRAYFISNIGNWNKALWWLATMLFPALLGLALAPLFIGSNVSTSEYFRQVYCPIVRDCFISLKGVPLPMWILLHASMVPTAIAAGLVAQWGYRHRCWRVAWWGYLLYTFSFFYLVATIMESSIFFGVGRAPIPTAIVGYGFWTMYTVQFLKNLLPPLQRLWRGEQIFFRPPPLKLQAGAGGAVISLGLLGVALGDVFGEIPHGNLGYLIIGILLAPWMVLGLAQEGAQRLLTLAPWRIVLEIEALQKKAKEEKL